jgi:hypothetical protein
MILIPHLLSYVMCVVCCDDADRHDGFSLCISKFVGLMSLTDRSDQAMYTSSSEYVQYLSLGSRLACNYGVPYLSCWQLCHRGQSRL